MSAILLVGALAVGVWVYEKLKPRGDPGQVPFSSTPIKTIPPIHSIAPPVPTVPVATKPPSSSPPWSKPISTTPIHSTPPPPPPPSHAPQRYCSILPFFSASATWDTPHPVNSDADCQSGNVHMSGIWDGVNWSDVDFHADVQQQGHCGMYAGDGHPICDIKNVPHPW
jgi:hypothetical protein